MDTSEDNLPIQIGFLIPIAVTFVPYVEQSIDYADISVTISNTSRRDTEVEIGEVAVLVAGSNQILLIATPQELSQPGKVFLSPGDNQVFNYRLKSRSKRYQDNQNAIAVIRYRLHENFEGIAVSDSEKVTVRNR